MKGKFDTLDYLVEIGNGYLQTSIVLENGISKPTLADYVTKRHLERVAHGIYRSKEAWPDELYLLQLANSRIVYSHETALFLHGLMEREPTCTSVTVRSGYNATHLRKSGVKVYQVKPEVAELGVTNVSTNCGNMVRVYDMERSICDMLRHKESMDVQVFQFAMKEYMASKKKNINNLIIYSKQFKLESLVRTYTEVLL